MLCGLGMQQYAMHSATIQKTTFFELGVFIIYVIIIIIYYYFRVLGECYVFPMDSYQDSREEAACKKTSSQDNDEQEKEQEHVYLELI